MKFITRFTKFPYVFWAFGRAIECQAQNNTISWSDKSFEFKKMSKWTFLALKYLPIILIFFLLVTKYDFGTDRIKLISYLFSILLFLAFFYLENLLRQVAVATILVASFIMGWYLGMSSMIAYVLKYAIILFCFFMFFVDLKLNAYELIQNGKIVSHFLTKEKLQ